MNVKQTILLTFLIRNSLEISVQIGNQSFQKIEFSHVPKNLNQQNNHEEDTPVHSDPAPSQADDNETDEVHSHTLYNDPYKNSKLKHRNRDAPTEKIVDYFNLSFESQEIEDAYKFIEFRMRELFSLMQECIETSFERNPLIDIPSVKANCVGTSNQILFFAYREALKKVREILFELMRIKVQEMDIMYNDSIAFFIDSIEQIVDSDFSIVQTIWIVQKKAAKYYVNPQFLANVIDHCKPELRAFDNLHLRLRSFRVNLQRLFDRLFEEQKQLVLESNREDLVGEQHERWRFIAGAKREHQDEDSDETSEEKSDKDASTGDSNSGPNSESESGLSGGESHSHKSKESLEEHSDEEIEQEDQKQDTPVLSPEEEAKIKEDMEQSPGAASTPKQAKKEALAKAKSEQEKIKAALTAPVKPAKQNKSTNFWYPIHNLLATTSDLSVDAAQTILSSKPVNSIWNAVNSALKAAAMPLNLASKLIPGRKRQLRRQTNVRKLGQTGELLELAKNKEDVRVEEVDKHRQALMPSKLNGLNEERAKSGEIKRKKQTKTKIKG